jgi:hypothetical protein
MRAGRTMPWPSLRATHSTPEEITTATIRAAQNIPRAAWMAR